MASRNTARANDTDGGNDAELRGAAATRARILHHAERLFGEQGYEGVSVRQIGIGAGVPVALVNYHFGSKEGLFRAIFTSRASHTHDERLIGLKLVEMETDPDRKLELMVKAILLPMIHLRHTEKSSSYAQIMAREVSSPSPLSQQIIQDYFDPVASILIDALAKALPDHSIDEVHWGYHTMIGAMVFIMADTGRIERLSNGLVSPDDEDKTAAHLVALLTAALKHGRVPPRKSPSQNSKPDAK